MVATLLYLLSQQSSALGGQILPIAGESEAVYAVDDRHFATIDQSGDRAKFQIRDEDGASSIDLPIDLQGRKALGFGERGLIVQHEPTLKEFGLKPPYKTYDLGSAVSEETHWDRGVFFHRFDHTVVVTYAREHFIIEGVAPGELFCASRDGRNVYLLKFGSSASTISVMNIGNGRRTKEEALRFEGGVTPIQHGVSGAKSLAAYGHQHILFFCRMANSLERSSINAPTASIFRGPTDGAKFDQEDLGLCLTNIKDGQTKIVARLRVFHPLGSTVTEPVAEYPEFTRYKIAPLPGNRACAISYAGHVFVIRNLPKPEM